MQRVIPGHQDECCQSPVLQKSLCAFGLAIHARCGRTLAIKPMPFELHNGPFILSTEPARLDVEAIYDFLSHSYWASARPRSMIEKSIRNSLCFGVYHDTHQIGFARVVTDCATFGYLADVYILEPYRRRGLGRWLIQSILSHPELKTLRRWSLATRDAHPLYRHFGFHELEQPQDFMELVRPYPSAPT